ncbi:MAG TPA: two-component regulator propeller domain-containing protein [Puia sp.]|nr:two-component regulator propeller domain-containing protein [Puia sp.]
MHLRKIIISLLVCTVICSTASSQWYNFISYNTDEGLPQSQVYQLLQADDRQLWMSTLGGISRFDGKTFSNYTISEGLAANYIIQFVLDHQQRAWAISSSNLNLIEGNKIHTWPLPENVKSSRARLTVTDDNILWCQINGMLYSFQNNKFVRTAGFPKPTFFSLFKGRNKNFYVMAMYKTLYKYHSGTWLPFVTLKLPDSSSMIHNIYIDSSENVWVLTQRELLVKRPSVPEMQTYFTLKDPHVMLSCLTRDRSGNFWLGSNDGAYKVRPDKSFMHFDYTNGFSNYRVTDILTDAEDNIWLGTDGDGLLKYGGGIFTSFDNGGNNAVRKVQIVKSDRQGNLLFGNTGADFCIYKDGKKNYPFKNTALKEYEIFCAFSDSHGAIWISTYAGSLWKYERGILLAIPLNKGFITGIAEDGDRIIISTYDGLLVSEKGGAFKNFGPRDPFMGLIPVGKDSILVIQQSLVLLKDTIKQVLTVPPDLRKTTITGFEKRKNKVFIGTVGGGIFIWDKTTGRFSQVSLSSGLATNIIYSLMLDSKDQLWAGTGKGVSRLVSADDFNTLTVRNYAREQGFKGMECNSGAIAELPDKTMWFGTARGLYCYHQEEDQPNLIPPKLTLRSVKIWDSTLVSPPAALVLPSDKNHITFGFRAISYSYNNIRYSYYLQGLENNFSVPDRTDFVVYPSLPPGKYVLTVKATDEGGRQLGDTLLYPVSIEPAFYQTALFKILLILAASGTVLLVYNVRKSNRDKQKRLIEALRAEEQRKIRKKTAADFHDEMGNKLARITVLSDILKSKLPANEEAQGLAQKIQENVAWLHQGTKDIIWSLNPDNDNLHFLLNHINHLGVDLFIDTDIEFEAAGVNEEFRHFFLPMDYARNIIMICKEVFTNILKHSQCTRVGTEAGLIGLNTVKLTITDNGRGMNKRVSSSGNGLINIRQRAGYLGADLELQSENGKGTSVVLLFTLPRAGAVTAWTGI